MLIPPGLDKTSSSIGMCTSHLTGLCACQRLCRCTQFMGSHSLQLMVNLPRSRRQA